MDASELVRAYRYVLCAAQDGYKLTFSIAYLRDFLLDRYGILAVCELVRADW